MKHRCIILLCLFLLPLAVFAQTEFDLYGHSVTPPSIAALKKGQKKAYAALGRPFENRYILLAQFESFPTLSDQMGLKQYGVTVLDNIADRTYFVAVKSNQLRECVKKANLKALFAPKPEWKISTFLLGDSIPSYALNKKGAIHTVVYYHEGVSEKGIKARLRALGFKEKVILEGKPYYTFELWIEKKRLTTLAKEPWVKRMRMVNPPQPTTIETTE